MKKQAKEEIPGSYIDRAPQIGLISLVLTVVFVYWTYYLLKDVNPAGFLMLIPSGFCTFQTIWLYLNPFAAFYGDRLEIRQSLFHHQQRFYIDIRKVSSDQKENIFITYQDAEVEKLNLFGARRSQLGKMKEQLADLAAMNQPAVASAS